MEYLFIPLQWTLIAIPMCFFCSLLMKAHQSFSNKEKGYTGFILIVTFVLGTGFHIYFNTSFFIMIALYYLYYISFATIGVREPGYTLLWSIVYISIFSLIVVMVDKLFELQLFYELRKKFSATYTLKKFLDLIKCGSVMISVIIAQRTAKYIYPKWEQNKWKVNQE